MLTFVSSEFKLHWYSIHFRHSNTKPVLLQADETLVSYRSFQFSDIIFLQGSQNSQLQSAPTANNFIAHVGGPDLWEPDLMPFNDWVKELAFRLATSGAVEDDIFQTVAPVCKLNVSLFCKTNLWSNLAMPLQGIRIIEKCVIFVSSPFRWLLSHLTAPLQSSL